MSLVQEIEQALPQTQCQGCGYAGCRPYAQALASGKASIDRCPPGGLKTLRALAKLLKQDPGPYEALVLQNQRKPMLARIDQETCIGCTKCIKACPVDAIVGTAKHLHHIVTHDCTGCGLCVEPCPVDCIEMEVLEHTQFSPERAHMKFEQRLQRLDTLSRKANRAQDIHTTASAKQDYILAALARVKQKKHEI